MMSPTSCRLPCEHSSQSRHLSASMASIRTRYTHSTHRQTLEVEQNHQWLTAVIAIHLTAPHACRCPCCVCHVCAKELRLIEHCWKVISGQDAQIHYIPLSMSLAALQVTQAAANIIRLRPPSVYKGKGIRLADTTPRTKPGKRK